MKKLYQFRYYGENNQNNFPSNLTLTANTNLLENFPTTIQLGIQAWAGAKFNLNEKSDSTIEVGITNIYELDLEGLTYLNGLYFTDNTLEAVATEDKKIIVDLVYEG